jgi:hypothetical protein
MLDDFALDYLAQGTDRMAEAASHLTLDDPVSELPATLGIGRTKSFAALSAALGADEVAVDEALRSVGEVPAGVDWRPAAYLLSQEHVLFNVVAERDWTRDVRLLEELLSDADSRARVEAAFGAGGEWTWDDVARDQGFLLEALGAKDWSEEPLDAAYLLGLGAPVARAHVAAEVAQSSKHATRLLWDKYHPQYKVWLPFAAIGLAAIIALAIFGQMAKRWKDMNA